MTDNCQLLTTVRENMRTQIIAGNWKMYKTVGEALDLVEKLKPSAAERSDVEVLVCPPFTALHAVADAVRGSRIGLGAQGMFWKTQGAYTSEVAPAMLLDVGCKYVIVGHSETRGRFGVPEPELKPYLSYFSETDETVNLKVKAALEAGLTPIVCVGETSEERKAGNTDRVIARQIEVGLAQITPDQAASLVIAYEPVWAIGTGDVCDTEEANRVCGVIRSIVRRMFGAAAADAARVQYGGSVKPDNAEALLSQPEIDGALVGGASLKADDFSAIIKAASI